jgi:RloB-like protein
MASRWRDPRPKIAILKKGLILCEGETEANYFNGLVSDHSHRRKFASIGVEIYKPKNHSPKGLLKEAKNKIRAAKKQGDPYDFAWIVFDKDGHESIPETFHEAAAFKPPIKVAFTAICFEYFILLHFVKTTKAFKDGNSMIKEVRKHLPDYEKASNLYSLLKDKSAMGLKNSEWCHKHCENKAEHGQAAHEQASFCNVHLLVNYLFDLIKK